MKNPRSLFAASAALGLLSSCAPGADPPDGPPALAAQALAAAHAPKLVQAGERLIVLGVTDDDHAIYWDNGSVYATALRPGAPRRFVAAAAQPPLTLAVGPVAMVWTAQPYFNALAPSPLVLWTAEHGPRAASGSSMPPALGALQAAAAVSPDGRDVTFVTNATPDGLVGDVVRASVDGARVTTLAAGVDVDPFGACPPHAGFNRKGDPTGLRAADADTPAGARDAASSSCPVDRLALVVACAPGAGAATLAAWSGDAKTELSANVLPNRPWVTDDAGRLLTAQLADNTPMVFDLADGTSFSPEAAPIIRSWVGPDGATVYSVARGGPTGRELRRTELEPAPRTEVIMPLVTGVSFLFSNHLPQGLPYYNVSTVPTSRDGELLLGFNANDPATGLPNTLFVVDVSAGGQTPVTLEASAIVALSAENATRDSRYILYYTYDPATGRDTLVAASRDGAKRQVSEGNSVFVLYGLDRSKIAYSDNTVGNPANLFSTTDLKSVDLGEAELSPTLVAPQAYNLFFPARGRRSMVYTSDAAASARGLFVARVR